MTPSAPRDTTVARGRRAERLSAGGTGGPLDLGAAVAVALHALGDLRDLPAGVSDGRLEAMLRASLDQVRPPAPARAGGDPPPVDAAVAATRTACAYLATRSFEDAYFALRTAHDLLPRSAAARR